jgi:hypothetical protein
VPAPLILTSLMHHLWVCGSVASVVVRGLDQSIDGKFHFRDFAQFVVSVNKDSFSLYSASYSAALLGHRMADATLAPPHEMLSIERKRQLLIEALHEKVRQHKKDLKSMFLEFDTHRTGHLSVEEMETGLRSIGLKLLHVGMCDALLFRYICQVIGCICAIVKHQLH